MERMPNLAGGDEGQSEAELRRRGLMDAESKSIESPLEQGMARRGLTMPKRKEDAGDLDNAGLRRRGMIGTPIAGGAYPEIAPAAEKAPERDLEALQTAMDATREKFLALDKKLAEGGDEIDRLELRTAEAEYQKARAEYVGTDSLKFVREEVELLKLKEGPKKPEGWFEKIKRGWGWLGDKNLGNFAQSRGGKTLGKMANLRTAINGALILGAWALPPAGAGVFAIRQGLAGAGMTFAAYDFQRKRAETKVADISNLNEMKLEEVTEKLHALVAHAHMKGSWAGLEESFEEVRKKYEAGMAEKIKEGLELQDYVERLKDETLAAGEKEKGTERARKWKAVGFGALGLLGFNALKYHGEISEFLASKGGASLNQLSGEGMRGVAAEAGGADATPYDAEIAALKAGIADLSGKVEAMKGGDIALTFQSGEGPIHQARKALSLALAGRGEEMTTGERLWAENRLWELAHNEMKSGGAVKEVWHPGDKIVFRNDIVNRVFAEMQERFGSDEARTALNENFKGYADRVNWGRYAVSTDGAGAWEGDGGVRYAAAPRVAEAAMPFNAGPVQVEVQTTMPFDAGPTEIVFEERPNFGALGDAGTGREAELTWSADGAARFDVWADSLAEKTSGLDADEYNAVRNMKVGEIVKKTYFGATEETRWPEGVRQNHADITRRLRLRDFIRAKLLELPSEERPGVATLEVHDFLKDYILKSRQTV